MIRGRGASDNPQGRFARIRVEAEEAVRDRRTRVQPDSVRSLISFNQSPDIPFDRSINPYRGCEHGCIYCFARPTHSYLELSPGLDFETRILARDNAAEVLERELSRPAYRCAPVVIGAATDPYQPVERDRGITRSLLQVLYRYRHPVSLVTKSALILRDLDLLAPMARKGLASVAVSVTTLDNGIKARLEPRASAGSRRLEVIRGLSEAGVPVTVLFAPVIPFINDHELETVVAESAGAGACNGGYVVLRLPHELGELWRQWLEEHYPRRAGRVMRTVTELHGGSIYRSDWFSRQRGQGNWAELIEQRFTAACRRHGLGQRPRALRTDLFDPAAATGQMDLFR